MIAAAVVAVTMAVVVQDQSALRAAPRDSAAQQAVLWQGDVLEVRGERIDHLQVWDHRRERAGFVKASQVRLLTRPFACYLPPLAQDELLSWPQGDHPAEELTRECLQLEPG